MKTLKNIFAIIALVTFFASCSPTTDINEDNSTEINATEGDTAGGTDDGRD